MYLFKNAWRSITRAKGRNILIGLIVFVIAVSSCLALSIRQAAENAKKSGMENMQITAQISVDRESLMKNAKTEGGDMRNALAAMPELSLSEMQAYAKSQYVEGFWYTLSTSVDASGSLEAVDTNGSPDAQNGADAGANSAKGGKDFPGGRMGTQGDFTLMGYSGQDAMTAFISGASKLTSGAMFSETGTAAECLISSELATLNSLSVGSTIKLTNPNNTSEAVSLKVVGVYTNTSSTQSGGMMGFQPGNDPANQILMSYNALKAITDASASNAAETTDETTERTTTTALRTQTAGTYQFSSVEQYEAFQKDVRTLGLSDEFTVSSQDVESFEASLVPLQNLSKFAAWFFVIVLVVGGVILVALNLFHIRERKYEIGVLTAIGMKKRKVASQFLAELLMVTFAAILLGTGVGAAVSVPTTNALLSTQISSQQEAQNEVNANFGRPGGQGNAARGNGSNAPGTFGKAVEYVSGVSSATDWVVVLELLGVGLLLVLLSGSAAVVSVLRYDPLKILSNRS